MIKNFVIKIVRRFFIETMDTIKEHWKKIYQTKRPNEVRWTEGFPKTSLEFIHNFNLTKSAKVIDIGNTIQNFLFCFFKRT